MSSSVNLSSILSSLSNSTSGFDVQSAVAQEIAAESRPIVQWQARQAVLQAQTADLTAIGTNITSLQDALNALGDPVGAFSSMTTSSSNTNFVTATAVAGAVAGNHVIVVNNLASTASWSSSYVASSSSQLTPGSFTLTVGSGTAVPITIGSGVNTLDQLVTYINGLGAGVNASVVNDSSGSRLALVAANSGTAGNFTISDATGLTFVPGTVGKNASLTVDGILIDSASNTVSGAVNGVTLNLLGASLGAEVNVSVAPDSSQISAAINKFVSIYNTLIGNVNAEYAIDGNKKEGSLGGDPVLRELQSMLLAVGGYSAGSGSVSTLGSLGISMNTDGTLAIDSTKLTGAIQNNFSSVQTFLQGTSSNGFVAKLNQQMSLLSDPVSGAFTVDLTSIKASNEDLQSQVDNFQTYIDKRQIALTNQYNQANIALEQLPILQAQIDAMLGNTSKKS